MPSIRKSPILQRPWYRSRWLALIGIALLIAGQWVWFTQRDQPANGLPLIVAGCVALLLAAEPEQWLAAEQIDSTTAGFSWQVWRSSKTRWLGLIVGISLVVFTGWRAVQTPPGNLWILLLLWAISSAAVWCALLPEQAIRHWIQDNRRGLRRHWREWLFVLIMFVAALGLRLIWLDKLPPLMAEDEAYPALQAADLHGVDHWEQSPFRFDPLQNLHPLLFHVVQAIGIELFGRTVAAARSASALIGALTIPGLYLAARRLFDRRVAVIAVIFMVTFTQHLHFSRLAMNNIVDATSAIWMVAFLSQALSSGNLVEYGLAGICLGLSQYGYSSSRLIPILFLSYIGLFAVQRRLAFKRLLPGLIIAVIIALVIVWPEAYGLLSRGQMLFPRLTDAAAWQSSVQIPSTFWGQQISRSVLGFVQLADNGVFYGAFDPVLGWIAPIFFLIGLALAIRHWREAHWSALLVWWLLTVLLGGVLLDDPPQFQRFVIVTPALTILVALGVIYTAETFAWLSRVLTPNQHVPRMIERWGIPISLVVALAGFNLKTYALDYPVQHGYFNDYRQVMLNDFADNMLPTLAGYKIWYFSTLDLNLWSSPILKYKVPDAVGAEYDIPPGYAKPGYAPPLDTLLQDLAVYQGKEAVVIAPHYPYLDKLIAQVSQIPGVTRWARPIPQYGLSVIVYYWDSCPTDSCKQGSTGKK